MIQSFKILKLFKNCVCFLYINKLSIVIMSKYNILNSTDIQLDECQINKVYKTSNGIIKGQLTHKKKSIYISTPTMILGSDVNKSGDCYLVDLVFNLKNKKNLELLNTIRGLDATTVSCIHEQSNLWYINHKDEVGLTQIERDFKPSIKSSLIRNEQLSMKLKIPINSVEFFDNNNLQVPYELLKSGYSVTAILYLSEICMEGEHIWLEWRMPQLKVNIPDAVLKGCKLVDVEDSDEEAEEDGDFY